MRTEPDALLSLQRYFGTVLDEPWDVRTSLERGDVVDRPFALVTRNGPTISSGGPDSILVTLAVTVHCYPVPLETMLKAEADELALRNTLWEAVEYGTSPARHRRLPLWDFDPDTVPAGEDPPFRAHCDYLRVAADPQLNTVREPEDQRRMMVALDLRCTFRRGQPVPSQTILQRIGASPRPGG